MSTFNHVSVLNIPTERSQHTTRGLHLNKKGKNLVVNNLAKEIKNLYTVHRTASPIVSPRGDVNVQTHIVCENSNLLGTIKDSIDCLNLEKNCDRQTIRGSVEGDPAGGLVTKAPINMTKDDGESSVNDNSLLKTVTRCEGESSVGLQEADYMGKIPESSVGPQEADYMEKIPGQNDKSQEEVTTRKSTRTKKNPSVMN